MVALLCLLAANKQTVWREMAGEEGGFTVNTENSRASDTGQVIHLLALKKKKTLPGVLAHSDV